MMKLKNKIVIMLLVLSGFLISISIWLSTRQVEIKAVHEDHEFSSVLVKNFPLTNNGKIKWWVNNNAMLKEKYHIPKPNQDGFFSVVFWDFCEGYKEEGKYDRRCFTDMKTTVNCIDKDRIFSVEKDRQDNILFTLDDGLYRMGKDGQIVKLNRE